MGTKNPFRIRALAHGTGAQSTSISVSIVENDPSNRQHSPVPPITAPSPQSGSRTSTPSPTVEKDLPPLPPRKMGTLNSATNLGALTATAQASTSPTVSLSPQSSSNISPPESLVRIFSPPSGPPPTHSQRTLSPPPVSPQPRRSQTPPPLPSRRSTIRHASPSPPRAGRGRHLRSNSSETMRVLAEDLPPAYTPGPDTRHGEQTVDIGPIRPFVQDDTAVLEESLRRHRQMGGMSGYPGPTRQQAWGSRGAGRGGLGQMGLSGLLFELLTGGGMRNAPGRSQLRPSVWNPPRGRVTTQLQPQITGTPVPPQPTGGAYISRQPAGTPPMGTPRRGWSQYPGQATASSSTLSVPPPPIHPSSPQTRRPSASTSGPFPQIQQPMTRATDARPTARATPGRPLLDDGRVLVYPLGYECPKCTSYSFAYFHDPVVITLASTTGHNRGFRPMRGSTFRGTPSALVPGDPSKPCRKCWDRYARSYEGPLVFADWEGNTDGTGGTNYQRPISDRPPMPEASVLAPPPSPAHSRTPSEAASLRSNHSMTNGPRAPVAPQHLRRGSRGGTVVRPGDPRIGGRMCWNCNGNGQVTVLIFNQERCRVCGGLGRVM